MTRAEVTRLDPSLVSLEGLRRGDARAFERLVRENASAMLAVARRILGDECEAQDALQQAFLSAFRSIAKFEGGCAISTWLHRIVVNAALMKLRHARSRPECSIDDLVSAPAETWPITAEDALADLQVRRKVRECIDQLPDLYREVLILRDIEELDTRETASILGLSEGGVKTRLHRARQALTILLQRYGAR